MCNISMKVDACAHDTVRSGAIDTLLRAETQITSREQEDTMNEKGNESKRGRGQKKETDNSEPTNGGRKQEESWGVPDR